MRLNTVFFFTYPIFSPFLIYSFVCGNSHVCSSAALLQLESSLPTVGREANFICDFHICLNKIIAFTYKDVPYYFQRAEQGLRSEFWCKVVFNPRRHYPPRLNNMFSSQRSLLCSALGFAKSR